MNINIETQINEVLDVLREQKMLLEHLATQTDLLSDPIEELEELIYSLESIVE